MGIGYLSNSTRNMIKTAMKKTQETFEQSTIVITIPDTVSENYPYQEAVIDSETTVSLSCVKYINPRDSQQFLTGQSIECDALAQLWVDNMKASGIICTVDGMNDLTKAVATLDGEQFEILRGELLDGNIITGEFLRCNLYLNRINSGRN